VQRTQLSTVDGSSIVVAGSVQEVERTILAAARGSLMELAWLTTADGRPVGVNPEHIVAVRELEPS
jgi:hypothetical protein